jgi:hypothetical protein
MWKRPAHRDREVPVIETNEMVPADQAPWDISEHLASHAVG